MRAGDRRGTERIRGRIGQRIRERVLAANPLCVHCEAKGITRPATQVDHIVALHNGGEEHPYDDSNRQGLCDDCHAAKTAVDLGLRVKVRVGVDGYPVDD